MEMVRPWHSTAYFTRPDNYSFNDDENKIEPPRAQLEVFLINYSYILTFRLIGYMVLNLILQMVFIL